MIDGPDTTPNTTGKLGALAWFHSRIRERQRDCGAPPIVIAALGDSVTSGAGLPGQYLHEDVYHAQLKRLLDERYPTGMFSVINAGDDGRDAPSGVKRLEEVVLHHQPDLLLIGYGLNDVLNGGLEGIDQYSGALKRMVLRTREASRASIVLLTSNMMPTRVNDNVPEPYRNLENQFIELQNSGVLAAYAGRVRELGDTLGVPVADVYAAWEELRQAGIDTTAMLLNGLNHPDASGHRIAAECILKIVAM